MDYVTRQFINLTKKFRKELRQALQKQTNAIDQATKATRESKQYQLPRPLPVLAELQIPEADKTEKRTQYDRSHTLQTWLTVGTWLAFIAAAFYAGIAAAQWRQMRENNNLTEVSVVASIESSRAARNSADAATKALRDSEDRFKIEQRPYIIVRDPHLNSIAELAVGSMGQTAATIDNVGRGIAFDEYGLAVVDIVDLDPTTTTKPEIKLGKKIDILFDKDVMDKMRTVDNGQYQPPLRDIPPEVTATIFSQMVGKKITGSQSKGIMRGESFILFMGKVRYISFDERRETEFCWFMTNPQKTGLTDPAKEWTSQWNLCKDHNTIR